MNDEILTNALHMSAYLRGMVHELVIDLTYCLVAKLCVVTMRTYWILLLAIFCGCGPSDRQVARQKFREAVAAMKVCAQGPTEAEFRRQRLALESCYQAHQSHLETLFATDFKQLVETMRACENASFPTSAKQSNALHKVQAEVHRTRQIHQEEVLAGIAKYYGLMRPPTAVLEFDQRQEMLKEQVEALEKLEKEPLSAAQAFSIVTAQNALADANASLRSTLNAIDQQCGKLLAQLR